jgi:hypothetical protein
MRLKTTLWSLLLLAFLAAAVPGQKTAAVKTQFTSIYTSLDKGCKTIRGSNGTDDAFICKGAAGYQVNEYSAAAASFIAAERKSTDETFPLATVNFDFDYSKTRLEWRMANGKPFAIILRVPKYGDPASNDQYFGKVIGYKLVIKGLKGFNIDQSVDAKTTDANVKARDIADKAYADHH